MAFPAEMTLHDQIAYDARNNVLNKSARSDSITLLNAAQTNLSRSLETSLTYFMSQKHFLQLIGSPSELS